MTYWSDMDVLTDIIGGGIVLVIFLCIVFGASRKRD